VYASDSEANSNFGVLDGVLEDGAEVVEFHFDPENLEHNLELKVDIDVMTFVAFNTVVSGTPVPVGVLSSQALDVQNIDPDSIKLSISGVEVNKQRCADRTFDINRDGLADLLCIFRPNEPFPAGVQTATVTGQMLSGLSVSGQDEVRVLSIRRFWR